ncbi:hypothetical protein GXW74_11600 [Roseomonas eburnea]|uniref:Uncharacterized protein n=1 Tax=Neoroseomonas eburnea TaxID=1346889 RepID=A0A9X9XBP7_9PROT|nr:hypothetical protein [Neoroseomonas eburnea]MBR0681133.1 hypothetical protein [Neoroseomonas eburnea]
MAAPTAGTIEREIEGVWYAASWRLTAGGEVIVSAPFMQDRRMRLGTGEAPADLAKEMLAAFVAERRASRRMRVAAGEGSDWVGAVYAGGAGLTGFVVFFGSWVYCIAHYGFLLGVGLGWLPSLIVAVVAAALWPIAALLLLLLLGVVAALILRTGS